ncbi:MAG TPA: 4-(cytidine 5'-diphospho)-2-C-methyl-D-erythritol kinase [Candidatus Dormibacteraeota bacterium]|nr:4-(cytidine 5'-diphospho)-2-C-methyl-D-erythritol kinase [Candidatus Dormibacteraeota bacterium]
MISLHLDAPAKLNLSLAIVGRRPDGYHLLVSDLVLLELADRLLLMPGSSGLRVEAAPGEEIPLGTGENLAWRGLVAGLSGEPELACLTLEKRIPAAAGLGGGSSDAAAAWRLGRRWRGADERAGSEELQDLAAIGADIPFFAARLPAARVEGIGERVAPLEPPAGGEHVVLIHPPFRLSTAAVFAELRPSEVGGSAALDPGRNDLLAPARRLRPELDDIFRRVAASGAAPNLTGSGPTVFARLDDPERATAIVVSLERAGLRVTQSRLRREAASIEQA